MPRISLYRPEKGNDYKFIDKTIWEMFQVGGVDVLVHKYIGPGAATQGNTPTTPTYSTDSVTNIQDLLFLENRDRKYDPDVYVLRGVYNISDTDFNLSQFGLFLQNDTIFVSFHITDTIEKVGRKLVAGDVIELPHLKDEYALNDFSFALKRFYVIEEVTRAAEGFSVTWYPHLYRAKCKPLVDSQEFKQILDQVADQDNLQGDYNPSAVYYPGNVVIGADGKNYTVRNNELTVNGISGISPPSANYYELSSTLRDIASTYEKEMQITSAILDQAELDAPKSGYDTTKYYHVQEGPDGVPQLISADTTTLEASNAQATDENGELLWEIGEDGEYSLDAEGNRIPFYYPNASAVLQTVDKQDYNFQQFGDALPPNGVPFSASIAFPVSPVEGQFHLRTDYMPTRLFRYSGLRWVKVEDNLRMTMNNLGASDTGVGQRYAGKDVRRTQKTSFINNTNSTVISGKEVKEKQSLSKALRPEADE